MISFDKFLDLCENSRAGSKTGLYPLGYDGIGNYPPAYMTPSAADALYYMSVDDRFAGWLEGHPFSIKHLPGDPVPPEEHKMPGKEIEHGPSKMPGKHTKPRPHRMPGAAKKPAESPLPGRPTKDCLVKKPKTLDPHLVGKSAEKSVCASKIPD